MRIRKVDMTTCFSVACNAMMLWKLKQGSGINFHKSMGESKSSDKDALNLG